MKTTVLVVDDNDDMAFMLQHLIGNEADLEFVGRLANADALMETIGAKMPRIVLMDLTMPGRSPMEAMKEASAKFPESRFVVISGYDEPKRVDEAVDNGAWGFVSKMGDIPAILKAIRTVAAGDVYLKQR